MDREARFAQALERVRRLTKEQDDCMDEEQIQEAFAEFGLNQVQLQMVYDYLKKSRIGPGEPLKAREEAISDRERDYLAAYVETVSAFPKPDGRQLEALTLSAMAGQALARQSLTEAYLGHVADAARLYAGQGVPMEDLIGEGNLALAAGIEALGVLESPGEAPGMLMRLVMDAMENCVGEAARNRRTDEKAERKVNRVAEKARELAGEWGRKVTPRELAAQKGLSYDSIMEALRVSGFQIEDIDDAKDCL